MKPSKDQLRAGFNKILAVIEAIRELKQITAGHLYANLMPYMDLATFEKILDWIVSTELVKRDQSHMLTWVGETTKPIPEPKETRVFNPCLSEINGYGTRCRDCGKESEAHL